MSYQICDETNSTHSHLCPLNKPFSGHGGQHQIPCSSWKQEFTTEDIPVMSSTTKKSASMSTHLGSKTGWRQQASRLYKKLTESNIKRRGYLRKHWKPHCHHWTPKLDLFSKRDTIPHSLRFPTRDDTNKSRFLPQSHRWIPWKTISIFRSRHRHCPLWIRRGMLQSISWVMICSRVEYFRCSYSHTGLYTCNILSLEWSFDKLTIKHESGSFLKLKSSILLHSYHTLFFKVMPDYTSCIIHPVDSTSSSHQSSCVPPIMYHILE